MNRLMGVTAVVTAVSTVVLSMTLNVWAFTEQYGSVFGTAIGVMLPLWILAATLAGKWGCSKKETWWLGVAGYVLAAFMLVVSLPHLAHGFDNITKGHWWESWSLAIVADLMQIIMKMILIKITKGKAVKTTAEPKKKRKKKTVDAPILAEVG